MAETEPLATYDFRSGGVDEAIEFLKRTRFELRMLRRVRVYVDRLQVFDINGDLFQIDGVGYPDAAIVPLLNHVNTAYKPERIHEPCSDEFKEFKTGRRYPWARDRVM